MEEGPDAKADPNALERAKREIEDTVYAYARRIADMPVQTLGNIEAELSTFAAKVAVIVETYVHKKPTIPAPAQPARSSDSGESGVLPTTPLPTFKPKPRIPSLPRKK